MMLLAAFDWVSKSELDKACLGSNLLEKCDSQCLKVDRRSYDPLFWHILPSKETRDGANMMNESLQVTRG